MKNNSISIIVPNQMYFGGDVIYGVVELNVQKEIKSRGVRFTFMGFERTRWSENNATFTQVKIFLSHRLDFSGTSWEQRKNAPIEKIQPGLYRYPFAITLPALVPASLTSANGKISYCIYSYVDIPRAFDLRTSHKLKVGGNLFPQISFSAPSEPVHTSKVKKFLFESGKVRMAVTIPKFSVFCGEAIPVTISVSNASSKSVKSVSISVLSKTVCLAHKKSITEMNINQKQKYPANFSAKSENTFIFHYVFPCSPSTASTNIAKIQNGPELVKVYHKLRISLNIPWATNLEAFIPITIMRQNPRQPIFSNPAQITLSPSHSNISFTVIDANYDKECISNVLNSSLSLPLPLSSPQNYNDTALLSKKSAPTYPVLENYTFPADTSSVLLEFGEHKVDEEESLLISV